MRPTKAAEPAAPDARELRRFDDLLGSKFDTQANLLVPRFQDHAPPCERPAAAARPIYVIRLRPKPGIDPIKALRFALKVLGRRFGPQAISIREEFCDQNARRRFPATMGPRRPQYHD